MNKQDYIRKPVSEYFGELVFGMDKIQKLIAPDKFKILTNSISQGTPLDPSIAPLVAEVMRDWAISKGATHFAHWFQPYTGSTAEKHQSFIELSSSTVIEKFTADQLIKGEPDASSFPSGGRRSTFEARGYTIWDPSSPAFLMEGKYNNILAIPSVFLSYNGVPLDCKTPLLKSIKVLTDQVNRLLKIFKIKEEVQINVGAEQEFFLLDREKLEQRYDLLFTGRTLIGADSPCEHLIGSHYFGSINPKVLSFMQELEIDLYRMGIPIKTRHNEVAPNQFEMTPFYENANLAVDHNQLLMEMTRKVAARNGLVAIFHEKPFKGVNGSGKHVNWSISTKQGKNLLEPGVSDKQDLIFMILLTAFLIGVDKYGHLLMASIASEGNQLRFGVTEAPPAIISVFLGEQLDNFLNSLVYKKNSLSGKKGKVIHDDIHLPYIDQDTTDRNRTAPIAFTGNKFEFRSPGGSQSISLPLVFLNTLTAYGLDSILRELEKSKRTRKQLTESVWRLVKENVKKIKRIRYEGNAYSQQWLALSKQRKLEDLKDPCIACHYLTDKETFDLVENFTVFSKEELYSLQEIKFEMYYRKIITQANLMLDMIKTGVYPALVKQTNLEQNINTGICSRERYEKLFKFTEILLINIDRLELTVNKISQYDSIIEKAKFASQEIRPEMEKLREVADQVEVLVDAEIWPFPRYRDLFLTHSY